MKNNKSLGQHWLKDREILDEIAALAAAGLPDGLSGDGSASGSSAEPANHLSGGPTSGRLVNDALCVEIGPGLGTLTSSLLRRFQKVVAIEYDAELARKLPGSFPGKNLRVINADILQVNLAEIVEQEAARQDSAEANPTEPDSAEAGPAKIDSPEANPDGASLTRGRDYVAVGNIPYYITSPIIRQLLTTRPQPRRIVLLVQKEVAERAAASAGEHSLLSLFVQNLADATLGPVVRAIKFTPPPKVDSQVLILDPRPAPQVSAAALQLARRGFASPRKKLIANLASTQTPKTAWAERLATAGLNPDARAQDLALRDWETLAAAEKPCKK